jgi:hypothetical protein
MNFQRKKGNDFLSIACGVTHPYLYIKTSHVFAPFKLFLLLLSEHQPL